jgi:hypothetical protein
VWITAPDLCAPTIFISVGSPMIAKAGLDSGAREIVQQAADAGATHFLVIGQREMKRPLEASSRRCRREARVPPR